MAVGISMASIGIDLYDRDNVARNRDALINWVRKQPYLSGFDMEILESAKTAYELGNAFIALSDFAFEKAGIALSY